MTLLTAKLFKTICSLLYVAYLGVTIYIIIAYSIADAANPQESKNVILLACVIALSVLKMWPAVCNIWYEIGGKFIYGNWICCIILQICIVIISNISMIIGSFVINYKASQFHLKAIPLETIFKMYAYATIIDTILYIMLTNHNIQRTLTNKIKTQ